MTYNDIRLLNESFQGLNDTLIRNRMLKEQRAERQASQQRMEQDAAAQAAYRQQDLAERNRHNTEEEALRRSMLDLETTKAGTAKENADTAAKKATQTSMFKWTGEDGVDYSAKDPAEFAQLVKEHPAKKEDDGTHILEMTGTDPKTGVTYHQKLKVPSGNDAAKGAAQNAITNFVQTTGVSPKATPQPKLDTERNKIIADTILSQNENESGSITNSPENMLKQYDSLAYPNQTPLPQGQPTPAKSKYKVEVLDQ